MRRRNPFITLVAASPVTAPDQRQHLERGGLNYCCYLKMDCDARWRHGHILSGITSFVG